jgi:hypothetical protein
MKAGRLSTYLTSEAEEYGHEHMNPKPRRMLVRILAIAALLLSVLYVGDYLLVRYRIPKDRDPLGIVQVQPYYAVPQKNKTTEFYFLNPQSQTCVHSLFPHLGYSPCWCLNIKKQKRINM